MFMRITWAKVRPGGWAQYEARFKELSQTAPGLQAPETVPFRRVTEESGLEGKNSPGFQRFQPGNRFCVSGTCSFSFNKFSLTA